MRYLVLSTFIACLLSSCWSIQKGEAIEGVAPGIWRGVFKLGRQNVPVLYQVNNSNNEQPLELAFDTGKQQLVSDTAYLFGDTLFAYFNQAQTYLKVVYQIDQMNGYLYDKKNEFYPIEFGGIKGPRHRFPNIREQPLVELTGEWAMTATIAKDSSTSIKLKLTADKNDVIGSLERDNGKRYWVEGTVQGARLYLSGFDGEHVVWLSGTIKDNQHLEEGSFNVNEESFFWEATRKAGVGMGS
jgi:hypothetical protein